MQAYVLKYLLFFSDDLSNPEVSNPLYTLGQRRFYQSSFAAGDDFSSLTDDRKTRWSPAPYKWCWCHYFVATIICSLLFCMSHYSYFLLIWICWNVGILNSVMNIIIWISSLLWVCDSSILSPNAIIPYSTLLKDIYL